MEKRRIGLLFKILPLVVLTSGALMAVPTLEVELQSGGTVTSLTGNPGVITLVGQTVGSWVVNVDVAQSTGLSLANPSVTNPFLTETASAVTTGASAQNLTISVSGSGFTGSLTGAYNLLSQQFGGPAFGTSAFSVYYDPGDALFAQTNQLGTTFSSGGASYTNSFLSPLSDGGTYSLTLVAVLTHSAAGTTNFTMNESVVPEPGFYGLLALGVGGLILVAQRKKKATARV